MTTQHRVERVELHPATDAWMSGDKFGDLIRTKVVRGVEIAWVRMDKTRRLLRVPLHALTFH